MASESSSKPDIHLYCHPNWKKVAEDYLADVGEEYPIVTTTVGHPRHFYLVDHAKLKDPRGIFKA